MGNQICSQIPLRIIVARGNSYSGISNIRCMLISDYLLVRIHTDPPWWACEQFGKIFIRGARAEPRAHGTECEQMRGSHRRHSLRLAPLPIDKALPGSAHIPSVARSEIEAQCMWALGMPLRLCDSIVEFS